jgi:uncharacterized cupredoxin-like copper-binding protein
MDTRTPSVFPAAAAITAAFLIATAAIAHDGAHAGNDRRIDYSNVSQTRFGKAADPARADRVVAIAMGDTMRFDPALITAKRGEIVRFTVRNDGQTMHEMILGTLDDLKEHAEHMRMHPGMNHDEPNMLHVAPGRTGEMGWQFTRAGEFYYGCLVPGHFEAGMVGKIIVTN